MPGPASTAGPQLLCYAHAARAGRRRVLAAVREALRPS